jgi:hypothetical protein
VLGRFVVAVAVVILPGNTWAKRIQNMEAFDLMFDDDDDLLDLENNQQVPTSPPLPQGRLRINNNNEEPQNVSH